MTKGFFRKTPVYIIAMTLFFTIFASISFNVGAEGDEPQIPTGGTFNNIELMDVEDVYYDNSSGTYFEITNSSYLNISFTSSEYVFVNIVSIPKIVSFTIESDSNCNTTDLILSGFEPNKLYYVYENSVYQFEFTSDENGTYFYTQDISTYHSISIKEEMSTIYIQSDGSIIGAPSGSITCDATFTYYDLNMNLNENIVIQKDGITFNGNGYTISGPGWGNGIEISSYNHDITIMNTIIQSFSFGIMISVYAYGNTITGCYLSSNYYGIWGNDRSHHNTIDGNTISANTYTGLYLSYYTNYYTITNNQIVNSQYYYGIQLIRSTYNTILNNVIQYNAGIGIYFESYCSHNLVEENIVNNNNYGIRLNNRCNWNDFIDNDLSYNSNCGIRMDNYCDRNDILGNIVSDNDWGGIYLASFCTYTTISNNIVNSNAICGIYFYDCDGSTINGNTISYNENHGIYMRDYCINNVISSNTILDNWNYGIYLTWQCNDNTIHLNTITNSGYRGVAIYDSINNTITENSITQTVTYDGLYLYSSDYTTIQDNDLTDNGQCGIQVRESCHHNTIDDNDLSYNSMIGVGLLYSCYDNTITNNTVSNCGYSGLYFHTSCYNNIVSTNTVKYNSVLGAGLWEYNYDNTFYNNYFENSINAFDDGYDIWNIEKTSGTNIIGGSYLGGNFWDDYTGSDTDGDGLGDTNLPYYSYGYIWNGGDYHPLVVLVTNSPPTPCAGGPYYGYEGTAILFDASCSTDPDNDPLQYRWDYNNDGYWDRELSPDPTGLCTWYDEYEGDAVVDVTDGIEWVLDWAYVRVYNVAPTADLINNGPIDEGSPATVSFINQYDPGIYDSFTYSFDLDNDGIYDIVDQTDSFVTFTWYEDGFYTVKGMIKDNDGGSNEYISYVEISDLVPTAEFTWCPVTQDEGSAVQFNDQSSSYPDSIIYWYWDFGDLETSNLQNPTHTYEDNSIYIVTLTVEDDDGSTNSISYYVTINNVAPIADAGEDKIGVEPSPFTFTGSHTDPGTQDTHTYEWDFDYDGATFDTDATGNGVTNTWFDDFDGTVALRVTDDDGGWHIDTCTVTLSNVAPTIETLILTLEPIQIGTPVDLTATFADPGILDTHTAIIDWGDGNTTTGTISGSDGTYTVTDSWIYGQPGVYTITLTVEDDDGGNDTMTFKYVVIYDPSAGFVTGGGWIMSPEGAYAPDPTLTGKANFGFVAKYKKGHSTPDGNTEFQFKVANLNFHSNDYEWLVIQIAGAKAMYKGTGTINGEGNYGFKITVIDEELTPSTSVDMFRIKIWDKDNNDAIIYDNQLGDEDDADPSTPISGGNIRIHEG